jgi:serine protease
MTTSKSMAANMAIPVCAMILCTMIAGTAFAQSSSAGFRLPAAAGVPADSAAGKGLPTVSGLTTPATDLRTVATGLPAVATDRNETAWEAIGLGEAAHFARFRRLVKVAIIDDGFDIDNPLWASHIAHNLGEIPENSADDDHNGKVDDYEGWDFGDNDENVRPALSVLDKESHGTRVLGIFWQVLEQLSAGDLSPISILPIKAVSDVKLNNYLKEGYKGIEYAIEQKADVIICSWSGPSIAPEEKAILARAQAKGIMIIASAGNFYAMQPMYPGAVPSVIDVAAVDREGRKLHTSNYGVFVDISAPGDSLVTFDPYRKTAGAHISATSAATPVIGAIVTALRAAYPGLSPQAIERLLKNTATPLEDKNPLYAGNLGAGLVNVAAIRDALRKPDPLLFHQVKAYIDLQKLRPDVPVRVLPTGRYRYIKFLLQPLSPDAGLQTATGKPATMGSHISAGLPVADGLPDAAGLPDIRACVFDGGKGRDTIIRRDRLKYPLLLTGDSVHIYRLADKQIYRVADKQTYRVSDKHRATNSGKAWWYYEVTTIDSSTLYCGGPPTEVKGVEGYIEDGSGDQNYTGRNDCKWLITVPEGKKMQLNFEEFDTEPKIDQVYIFSGNSTKDPILAIFSGHKIPPVIKSWGNTVLVWFLTSEENNFPGWKLHYKAVE